MMGFSGDWVRGSVWFFLIGLCGCTCNGEFSGTRGTGNDADSNGSDCVDDDGDGFGANCERGDDCDDSDAEKTGTEYCDGLDNDCDDLVDEGALSSCGTCDSTCAQVAVGAGDTDEAFMLSEENAEGVSVDEDGAIVLDSTEIDTSYIWIANTMQGTVSKIDTRTYVELARYRTGPVSVNNDPSRTSVNLSGDVYIGNRAGASVTKISALGADCPDTDGDGVVRTSTGAADILDWGTDDCVLWNTEIPGSYIRAVAAQDAEGPDGELDSVVWVGDWNTPRAYKLDGETGDVLVSVTAPVATYGFALDASGNLWISTRHRELSTSEPWSEGDDDDVAEALGRIDTTRCTDSTVCEAETVCGADGDDCIKQLIPTPGQNYGITVDFNQRVWLGGNTVVTRYDPSAALGSRFTTVEVAQFTHGIAADANGWVWAAAQDAGVFRINAEDPTMWTLVPNTEGESNKGMAIDFDGKVWSITRGDSATVIEPGPGLSDNTVTANAATGLVEPYTYSDMTGQQLRYATNPRGHYQKTFVGCSATDTVWHQLLFTAETPTGTYLVWRIRTAASEAELESATWSLIAQTPDATSPIDLAAALLAADAPPLTYLEVEVQLHAERTSTTEIISPRVTSLSVSHLCPPTVM